MNRSVLFGGESEPTDRAPSAAADDQRRSDQADRQPQPECRCVGHQLENGEGDERADRQLAEHGTVEGVVANAQYAGRCQRGEAGNAPGQRDAGEEGPLVQARELLDQQIEPRCQAADDQAGKNDLGHFGERLDFDQCDGERRLRAQQGIDRERSSHGGDDHGQEVGDGVLHHHHFHGKDDAGDGRVEGAGQGGGGSAGDQRSHAVIGQPQPLAEQACCRGAQVDGRSFPAPGLAGEQCGCPAEELHHGVAGWQPSAAFAQAGHDMGHADSTLVAAENAQCQSDDEGARQRQGCPLQVP